MEWILIDWLKPAATVYLFHCEGGKVCGIVTSHLFCIERMLMVQVLTPSHSHTNQVKIKSSKSTWKTTPGIYFNKNVSYWEKFLSEAKLDT